MHGLSRDGGTSGTRWWNAGATGPRVAGSKHGLGITKLASRVDPLLAVRYMRARRRPVESRITGTTGSGAVRPVVQGVRGGGTGSGRWAYEVEPGAMPCSWGWRCGCHLGPGRENLRPGAAT